MKSYTECLIESGQEKTKRAIHLEKKEMLRKEILQLMNYNAPKKLTVKELNQIISEHKYSLSYAN